MSQEPHSYYLIGCRAVWRELYLCAAQSKNRIEIALLPQGLHNTPDLLRKEMRRMISNAGEGWDAILCGYGLCCNGLAGLSHPTLPLVLPRAHDCITLLLGSKETYRDYFEAHPGTYWYSSGWFEETDMPGPDRDEKTRQMYVEKYGEENADFLMEETQRWRVNYHCATFVDWGLKGSIDYIAETQKCAEYLGWSYDRVEGNNKLLMALMNGEWDERGFLVVPPGHTIIPSHDETIVKAEKDGAAVKEFDAGPTAGSINMPDGKW